MRGQGQTSVTGAWGRTHGGHRYRVLGDTQRPVFSKLGTNRLLSAGSPRCCQQTAQDRHTAPFTRHPNVASASTEGGLDSEQALHPSSEQ